MTDFTFPAQANLCRYFLTARLEEGLGSKHAILTREGATTYAELDRMSARVAELLRARGVQPEQRVLIMLRDGVEFAAAFFAGGDGTYRIGYHCDSRELLEAYYAENATALRADVAERFPTGIELSRKELEIIKLFPGK